MNLPNTIDKTIKGKLVKPAKIGESGYAENINYQLTITIIDHEVSIDYYGEDDSYLSDKDILKLAKKFTITPKLEAYETINHRKNTN